jgi:hypothetical protein
METIRSIWQLRPQFPWHPIAKLQHTLPPWPVSCARSFCNSSHRAATEQAAASGQWAARAVPYLNSSRCHNTSCRPWPVSCARSFHVSSHRAATAQAAALGQWAARAVSITSHHVSTTQAKALASELRAQIPWLIPSPFSFYHVFIQHIMLIVLLMRFRDTRSLYTHRSSVI